MNEKIEPALTLEEWRDWTRDDWRIRTSIATACDCIAYDLHQDPAKLLALANAALPDDDPRKITREWVEFLRAASVHEVCCASFDDANPSTAECDCDGPARAAVIADALESYLPPEGV